MKLRNKETGGLANLIVDKDTLRVKTDAGWADYNSLAELNKEWEDYEEPKMYWRIDCDGEIEDDEYNETVSFDRDCKSIGNYFKTREEAERAVEKLKAWKRLKDKGFRFKCCDDYHIDYEFTGKCAWTDETEADLDLLFGGGE